MKAPVVLFVYNRPEHTRRTIEALSASDMATDTPLYIFSDGAKETSTAEVEEVRRIIHNIKGFASINICERDSNTGLARNIISGVSEVLKTNSKVIVLEDDLIVSRHFLTYMNAALDYYEDKNVFSVSGFTPNVALPQEYPYTTYMTPRNCSWGWGTWRDRWESVDWNVSDFDQFIRDKARRSAFDQSGSDLSAMLLRYKTGEIHSWSIRFCYAAFCQEKPTVYPTHSLVRNGGVDGSGTNMKRSFKYDTQLTNYLDCTLFQQDTIIDKNILASFKRTYDCSLIRRAINALKRVLYIKKHPHNI